MTRYFSTSLSVVLFSAGSHLRGANKPHANGNPAKSFESEIQNY
jgi:hypothetical protein